MFEPIESGIAINAAERTDSDCAEEILLHGAAPMRPKYLGTPAMWTRPFGVRAHNQWFPTIILEIMHGQDGLITIRVVAKLPVTYLSRNTVSNVSRL